MILLILLLEYYLFVPLLYIYISVLFKYFQVITETSLYVSCGEMPVFFMQSGRHITYGNTGLC
jgi:hypothetical protein